MSLENLTMREQEVIKILLDGKSNKQIASLLPITEGTVEKHLTRIYMKLNVQNRLEASLLYLSNTNNSTENTGNP